MSSPFDKDWVAPEPKATADKVVGDAPDLSSMAEREKAAKADGWLQPGEHDIEGERYHLDPCETPSLSASLAKVGIEKSMWHLWEGHTRLNPAFEPKDSAQFRDGRAFHTLLLGKGNPVEIFDYKDWRTDKAKADMRDSLANGNTPLLRPKFEKLTAMVRSVKRQISAREELAYAMAGGVPERAYIWQEDTPSGPVMCRMMVDWTPHSGRYAVDWKSTAMSAGPNGWGAKTIWDTGCDIQDAFYRRGFRKVLGRDFDALIFAVAETDAPHAMMHHRIDPEAQEQADKQVEWAINAFAMCLHRNRWPGYPTHMAWQTKPAWRSIAYESKNEAGMLDLAQLDAHIANLKEIAEMRRDAAGVPITDDNPFGLPPIGEGE